MSSWFVEKAQEEVSYQLLILIFSVINVYNFYFLLF